MALRLFQHDQGFFDLFTELAEHGVRAAHEVTGLLRASRSDASSALERLREAESEADATTHRIIRKTRESFVTPFDHSDMVGLATSLDRCVDELESLAFVINLYGFSEPFPGLVDVIDIIGRMAELTADVMPRLRSMRGVEDYWIEINRLENDADQRYRRMLTDLFDGRITDPVQVVKRKDLLERLELCADAFEAVAHQVELIASKES